jgi:hypothetical protein
MFVLCFSCAKTAGKNYLAADSNWYRLPNSQRNPRPYNILTWQLRNFNPRRRPFSSPTDFCSFWMHSDTNHFALRHHVRHVSVHVVCFLHGRGAQTFLQHPPGPRKSQTLVVIPGHETPWIVIKGVTPIEPNPGLPYGPRVGCAFHQYLNFGVRASHTTKRADAESPSWIMLRGLLGYTRIPHFTEHEVYDLTHALETLNA